jgi:hypothetical protein
VGEAVLGVGLQAGERMMVAVLLGRVWKKLWLLIEQVKVLGL